MSNPVKISEYPIHPAAELFPMMSEKEFQLMKEDIRLHGQQDDVLIWNGTLLDGRNRLRACTELGIEPGWAELPATLDPVAWVLSHNLHRRHLTTAQRAMVAEKLATLRLGDNQHSKEGGSIEPPSRDDAAKALHVSTSSVKRARKVRTRASKKVIAAVEAGTMSLNAALETTKQSDAEKAARAEARKAEKAAKEKAKAEAKAIREAARAEKLAEKEAKAKAKAEAQAEKEARQKELQTPEGKIKAMRNMINQHIGKAIKLIGDMHLMKPNRTAMNAAVKLLGEVKLW